MVSVSIISRVDGNQHRLGPLQDAVARQSHAIDEWLILDQSAKPDRMLGKRPAKPIRYSHAPGIDSAGAALQLLVGEAKGDVVVVMAPGHYYGAAYVEQQLAALADGGLVRLTGFAVYAVAHGRFGYWDQSVTRGLHCDWSGAAITLREPDQAMRQTVAPLVQNDPSTLVFHRGLWAEAGPTASSDAVANLVRHSHDRGVLRTRADDALLFLQVTYPGEPGASLPQSLLPDLLVERLDPGAKAFARAVTDAEAKARARERATGNLRRLVDARRGKGAVTIGGRRAGDRPTICLNMIVKNESRVIERCLASVKPFIDHWVIVDTGSTDGTQELIRRTMADVPGQLYERPWRNFGHNRNEALELAADTADYLLFIDADETFCPDPGFGFGRLHHDAYNVIMQLGGLTYRYPRLVRAACGWQWKGVLHEYLESPNLESKAPLDGAHILARPEGARSSDPNKYKRDALVLEQALIEEPDNTRYVFYLAQSYRDAGVADRALAAYQQRAAMGGWQEEVFEAKLQIALLRHRAEHPWPETLAAFMAAVAAAPHRAEPLYWLGQILLDRQAWAEAWVFLSRAIALPFPKDDVLFVDRTIYDWRAPMAYAICAYWLGEHAIAVEVNDRLLARADLPGEVRDRIQENRRLSCKLLGIAA